MKQIQVYTYTIPALGSVQIPAPNDNFFVQAANGPVTVRGDTFGTLPNLVAGQGLKAVPFGRLELKDESGAPNTVTVLLSPAEFVNQVFSGSVSVVGSLALDAATIAALARDSQRPELPSANWTNNIAVAANVAVPVFAAAANPNGAIVLAAGANDSSASAAPQSFVAKATAPANVLDGDVIAMSQNASFNATGTVLYKEIELVRPMRIAPGLGLYFISTFAGVAVGYRFCRYVLL